ncbi:MAG: hypothetical protein JWO53_922, partial [Chlamydiia bacterium]|nr:hypothetical protein [Chlamydiia bacterium]
MVFNWDTARPIFYTTSNEMVVSSPPLPIPQSIQTTATESDIPAFWFHFLNQQVFSATPNYVFVDHLKQHCIIMYNALTEGSILSSNTANILQFFQTTLFLQMEKLRWNSVNFSGLNLQGIDITGFLHCSKTFTHFNLSQAICGYK